MENVAICPSLPEILEVMREQGYSVGDEADGSDLNLIGIRSAALEPETFSDWIAVAYRDGGVWNFFPFPATTDPGTFWQRQPDRVRGSAVLEPGQYPGLWQLGRHRGRRALRQRGPARVWRAARREHYLDTAGEPETTRQSGIDLFAAPPAGDRRRWSAGAQVLHDPLHARFLLGLCERAAGQQGRGFSYTLLEEADFVL
ncbi:MAG: hypothetical protein U5K73_00180 [Halofilum sp. (in: g-proteobacteria)]|nr:hypothetical protein [Halofilum sp. (in: g-proteobacteria)]